MVIAGPVTYMKAMKGVNEFTSENEVYPTMILWHTIHLTLHWNDESVFQLEISIYDHYYFVWKSFLGWLCNSLLT